MGEKEINNLIEWAKEVEKKCAYSAAYILAAHGRDALSSVLNAKNGLMPIKKLRFEYSD